jgi:polar amino acid transport system substrate-binding protein
MTSLRVSSAVAMTSRAVRLLLLCTLATAILSSGTALAGECTSKVDSGLLIKPGSLVIVTNPTLPPMQYADQTGQMKGMRIDLAVEVAKRLCLQPEFVDAEYSVMIAGLRGGRWDMIDAGLFVTSERLKILYMIPYEDLAVSISTRMADKDKIKALDDLSGKAVATDLGGYDEKQMRILNEDFRKRGLPQMDLRVFDGYAAAYQALRAGQVDATTTIDPVAKQYEQRGEFAQVLSHLYATPGSLSFGNKALATAVSDVLKDMKKDGSFDALLSRYGVSAAPGDLSVKGPDA